MTKKHFIAIADAIKANRAEFSDAALGILARQFSYINQDFKSQRWFDYIDGKVGPNGGKVK